MSMLRIDTLLAATRTRRQFLAESATAAASVALWPRLGNAIAIPTGPKLRFPSRPHDRICVASYPFRDVIAGPGDPSGGGKIALKDFAAHVISKFGINKIEPWSRHFLSLDAEYLGEIRAALERSRAAAVNIAVDGEHSPYAADGAERERAVEFGKKWVDVAAAIGSPSIRTNIPQANDSEPSLERVAESLGRVAEYGAAKSIVMNLENDNPVTEDPFFLVKLVDIVKSPWLHLLPDFGNTLVTSNAQHAYGGVDAMFGRAYNICHVKEVEGESADRLTHVDLARTFGMLKKHGYRGYCSIEWDSPGDPYRGTAELIEKTAKYLA
jgi:sugar phosphate isomerase/epimerase